MGTKAGRQLYGRSKNIAIAFDRLSRRASDSHFDWMVVLLARALRQFALNLSSATDGGCRRNKGCHNPITGMFDLAPIQCFQRLPHDGVVDMQELHRYLVA